MRQVAELQSGRVAEGQPRGGAAELKKRFATSPLRHFATAVLLLPGGLLIAALGVVVAAAWAGAIYISTFSAILTGLWDGLALWRAQRAERRAAAHCREMIRAWACIPLENHAERFRFLPHLDDASDALDRALARTTRVRARIAQRQGLVARAEGPQTNPSPPAPHPSVFVHGPGSVQ